MLLTQKWYLLHFYDPSKMTLTASLSLCLTRQTQYPDTQSDDAGPSGGVTYPGQVQEECQKQPSPSVHRTSVMNADTAQADFAEAPLSVAALLARMQKLKSTK